MFSFFYSYTVVQVQMMHYDVISARTVGVSVYVCVWA